VVDHVAHAFKHVETDGRNSLKESQVVVRPPAAWDHAAWDESAWDDQEGTVSLDKIDLLSATSGVVAFLEEVVRRGFASDTN
jgi:hypothetical protein